jgi:hypothetical protein
MDEWCAGKKLGSTCTVALINILDHIRNEGDDGDDAGGGPGLDGLDGESSDQAVKKK